MLLVADIYEQAGDILGICDQTKIFAKITEAQRLLANKALWDPTVASMSLCVTDENCVTLPRFVKTPMAINIDNQPAMFLNKWFEHHINGPGSTGNDNTIGMTWQDKGEVVTFQDPLGPSQLVAFIEEAEDANIELRVYGFDINDKWIRTQNCATGEYEDGFLVPTILGYAMPNPDAPILKSITRVQKPVTKGFVKLVAWDKGSDNGASHIGYYYPDETEPRYKRIRISQKCSTVYMHYRKADAVIRSQNDLIPLHSSTALMLMLKALAKYDNDRIQEARLYEDEAVRLLTEEQESRSGPGFFAPQVSVESGGAMGAWFNMR